MKKLFSQEIRFKPNDEINFPEWQFKPLKKISQKVNTKNKDCSISIVLTNSAKHGIVNQQDYFDKDIANQNNLGGYYVVDKNDFVYNPRISESSPYGPIKRNKLKQGVMSPLYSVFRFHDENYLCFMEHYFNTALWHRYMHSVANTGARHDRMNISIEDFMGLPLPWPCLEEARKIVEFIDVINN